MHSTSKFLFSPDSIYLFHPVQTVFNLMQSSTFHYSQNLDHFCGFFFLKRNFSVSSVPFIVTLLLCCRHHQNMNSRDHWSRIASDYRWEVLNGVSWQLLDRCRHRLANVPRSIRYCTGQNNLFLLARIWAGAVKTKVIQTIMAEKIKCSVVL